MDGKDLLKRVKEDKVKFISLQFTDVMGAVKSVDMPVRHLEGVLTDGAWFDGSSVEGFAPVSYTHLRAHETVLDLVCRLLLEKKKKTKILRYH